MRMATAPTCTDPAGRRAPAQDAKPPDGTEAGMPPGAGVCRFVACPGDPFPFRRPLPL